MDNKDNPSTIAKLIWESWISDSTNEDECVYEEGEGKED